VFPDPAEESAKDVILQPGPMKVFKELLVTAVVAETSDTRTLVLEPLGPEDVVSWEAGQFLTLVFPHPLGEDRRSYSISSVPALGQPLSITVKRIANGAWSRMLTDRVQPGDRLLTIGASGFFTLPEAPQRYKQFLFFAAGSGITRAYPLPSSIATALQPTLFFIKSSGSFRRSSTTASASNS
jgi:ring-1,2-phenylacetyl-CoA epoxidase subunit PaaE